MASVNELLQAAGNLLDEGEVESALELTRQAGAKAPNSARVAKAHGACLIANGDFENAANCFELALSIDPDDTAACHDLGVANQATGNRETARLHFERALTLNPENMSTHEALAAILVEDGEFDDAIRHLQIALNANPEDANTIANFAAILMRVGALYDARVHFEKAYGIAPDNPNITVPLIHILQELGELGEAHMLAEKLYLRRPRDPVALAPFASALAQTGDLDQARRHAETCLKLAPDFVPALDAFALVTAYQGEPELGIARLSEALKKARSNPHLYLSMAAALLRIGRFDQAVAMAGEALKDGTARASAYLLLRQCLSVSGNLEQMVELSRELASDQALGGAKELLKGDLVIPFETKPLEAVLLSRFASRPYRVNGEVAANVSAPEPLLPLLKRMPLAGELRQIQAEDLAKASVNEDAHFITQLALNQRLLTYSPDKFQPYLFGDPQNDDFWRGSLAPLKPPFAGVVWSKYPPAARLQDIDVALADWPGTIVSLVWDDQRMELEGNRRIIDAGRHLASLEALVDLIGKMDLVVGTDSLALHIAGAMGVPGAALVTQEKSWYWYHREGKSFWYPSFQVVERLWQETDEAYRDRVSKVASTCLKDAGPVENSASA
ncbi:tetratricopeptide repeat protein [Roseibium marinum]|uniref:Tfp pilus assembly protein PilF n=1 Tax=Roseibium marinum TaxID=281252 RepID=A0A2S3V1I3_9HYPH|nr:tetratricopeptide repeat protein [Roseibium marinum]POF33775.1 Tfp pilus assembly protein PilF [Roseibium marinum]